MTSTRLLVFSFDTLPNSAAAADNLSDFAHEREAVISGDANLYGNNTTDICALYNSGIDDANDLHYALVRARASGLSPLAVGRHGQYGRAPTLNQYTKGIYLLYKENDKALHLCVPGAH